MKRQLFTETGAFKLLHPSKNINIDFTNLYDNSTQVLYWQCNKDIRHVFQQKICSKTLQGYDCPYCSGVKTLSEESLAVVYPQIASELHPIKNTSFDPFKYSPTSNKKVVWLCSEGHEWSSRVESRTRGKDSGCPTCRKRANSFGTKYPSLLNEWDSTKNVDLNPFQLSPSSNKPVWWKCSVDPSHGNWKRVISTRTSDPSVGCPSCNKKPKNVKLPRLSEYSSFLCQEWHPTLNEDLQPANFTAGSSKKVWWVCSKCKNEWEATISNRARKNKGCPACSRNIPQKGSSILEQYPDLVNQWHPEKNNGLKPENFSYGSAQEIWWQCLENPEHTWLEPIVFRTKKNTKECKLCKIEANSLELNFPEIAGEWHPTLNGDLKPSEISQSSGQKVWWQCSVNPEHEWLADVRNRTTNKSKCKKCASEKRGHYYGYSNMVIDKKDIEIYHVFNTSIQSLSLLTNHSFKDNKRLIQPVYRMIYSSVITALESYLSDSFLNKTLGNSERVTKVISTNSDLNEKKYSVSDILDWHKNVESRVEKYLTDIIWHNMHTVRSLYKNVLGISFPENSAAISKAVGIRHDLVHRNGKTKKGKVHILNEFEVSELISNVEEFIGSIQKQLVVI